MSRHSTKRLLFQVTMLVIRAMYCNFLYYISLLASQPHLTNHTVDCTATWLRLTLVEKQHVVQSVVHQPLPLHCKKST